MNLETKVLRMVLRTRRLWSRIAEDFKAPAENKSPGQGTLRATGEGALPNRRFQTVAGSCLLRCHACCRINSPGRRDQGPPIARCGSTEQDPRHSRCPAPKLMRGEDHSPQWDGMLGSRQIAGTGQEGRLNGARALPVAGLPLPPHQRGQEGSTWF